MSKRQRTNTQVARRAKRPIDKKIISVTQTVANAQVTTEIYPAATFPGTITGLRWSFNVVRIFGTAATGIMRWILVVVPAGVTIGTIGLGNSNSAYDPEQNVLAFGDCCTSALATGCPTVHIEGSTKSMRKLKVGDKLMFAAIGDSASNTHTIFGTVQMFYKT